MVPSNTLPVTRNSINQDSPDDHLAVTGSVANMAVEGELGPDPAVCIVISPLRQADLAIDSPAVTFSRRASVPWRAPHTPVLSSNLDATGSADVMAL